MQPFSLHLPTEDADSPLIVEVPHAGLHVPAHALSLLDLQARSIAEDADLYVDALFSAAPAHGASLLLCHLSRYVVDMNRSELDLDARAVRGHTSAHASAHGVIWWQSGRGERALRRPLHEDELQQRLRDYHRPYHAQLKQLIERARKRFGFAVVLAAHSMPSRSDRHGNLADVVPGSRGQTSCARSLLQPIEQLAQQHKLSLRHDVPYRGGYTTGHYGRPREHVHVVQIELSRRLYMSEAELLPHHGFDKTRAFCDDLVRALRAWRPETSKAS